MLTPFICLNISEAYCDYPLPIGQGQTISQPFIVALMAEAAKLQPTDKVLEIGTGCGYSAAVLSKCAREVYSAEIIQELGNAAKERLRDLKFDTVHVLVQDGSVGFREYAPFDAIIVTAGAPQLPFDLMCQLSLNGRMVIPVLRQRPEFSTGITHEAAAVIGEQLLRVTRVGAEDRAECFTTEVLTDVRFVPLRGKAGWKE
mmetsp:Transcript_31591/g.53315  ORF Transcript_31591/g.53315 Transcript_31591/m.53315 type:complete len:201 (-) Transcript_31591:138-740(-)